MHREKNNRNIKVDDTDLAILHYLGQDGRMPVRELAEKLNVSPPTVYTRIKNLLQSGVLKIAGQVDTFKLGQYQSVLIAINIGDDSKMEQVMDALVEFEEVQWAAAVTGRYDIFVELALKGSMEDLFVFHAEKLASLEGVADSESFVITRNRNKWSPLPPFTVGNSK